MAKAERAANPNTLYLFNGDMLSPSLASGFDMGQNTIDFTNLVPFDLAVPGNHEYDFGPENFTEKMKASKYPWAAINITNADGSPVEGLGGVMMKEVAGLKIALIPVAQDTSPEVSSTGSLKFLPTVDSGIAAADPTADATASANWRRVGAVRMSLLLRSTERAGTRDLVAGSQLRVGGVIVTPVAGSGLLRVPYDTTIAIRNRLFGN